MQGYLFSKPLPANELGYLLRAWPVLSSPPLQPEAEDGAADIAARARSGLG